MDNGIDISEEEKYYRQKELMYEVLLRNDIDMALEEMEKDFNLEEPIKQVKQALEWLNNLGYEMSCEELMDLY